MSTMTADQFLMGGGGAPSAFTGDDPIGTTRGGVIVEPPSMIQQTDFDSGDPLFWDDGSKRMQMVVTVQTDQRDPSRDDDDGHRRFYVKGGNLQQVIRDAVKKAGAPGLEVGGTLMVTRVGQGEPKRKGGKAPWLHTAVYTPAAQNFLANGDASTSKAKAPVPAATPLNPAEFPHLSPEQLAGVQQAGFSAEMARQIFPAPQPPADELTAAAFPHLSVEQLAGLKAAGVTAAQVRAMFPA